MRRPLAIAGVLAAAAVSALAACGGGGEDVRAVRELRIEAPAPVAKVWRDTELGQAEGAAIRAEAPVAEARRPSRAVGRPFRGRLENGVLLPTTGPDHLTWDPILDRLPNRPERRWGTDVLVQTLRTVLARYRAESPGAPQVLIADLSRPRGGVFDRRFGGLGHASHQNGLDADVQYPRADRRLTGIRRAREVDRELAQALVDAFVAAGAEYVFVGTRLGLTGPDGVVQEIPYHNDHLHVRIRNPRG